MFSAPRTSAQRQRSASRSTDDHSKENPRKLFQRYARDLSISSQSLATTSSYHDDLPTPSMPTHAPQSHPTSAQSTPMTSPSTGYSSLFPGSLSSATSESVPSAESKYRSEFGVLTPGSHSPILGSASSRSSNPWTTESDAQPPLAPRIPRIYPSSRLSHRPSTAPHSPTILAPATSADSGHADRHTRSHSRLTMSIKNLLSKPAVPSPSRFSVNSATTTPSESEASSSSLYVPATSSKWPMTPRKLRPPDLEISGSVALTIPSSSRTSNTLIDAHRRYASEAAAKIYNARTGYGLPTGQDSLDVSAQNAPPPPTRGREPKTRNVLRRRPSGSARLFKGRERGISSPGPHEGDLDRLRLPPKEGISCQGGISFPLTPASAVVEAYKQQELHRDDTSIPSKLSIDDQMRPTASHDGRYGQDHSGYSPVPYYTVFGSSSSRRMQMGGPDDRWSKFEPDRHVRTTSQATPSHQPSTSDSVGRSLTRKVSARLRKLKGEDTMSEESPSRGRGHSKGRPSLQEMCGGDKFSMRSTGRSMDGVSNAGDGAWASPIAGHARSGSEKGDGSEGGKLWRLMRRISTGGLRDRFQAEKAVPPVPAIPKELLGKANQGDRGNEPLSTSSHQASSFLHDKDPIRPSTAPRNITIARPSMATSSPNSSDLASTQFFHKTHSTRSSISSYGEAVLASRAPDVALDQHIITPLEQLRLGDGHVQYGEPSTSSMPVPRSPPRSTSVPAGLRTVEDVESSDRVPLPSPRRQTCSGDPSSCGSSTSSTSACASGGTHPSYQNHGLVLGQSRIVDGIVSLSPPPRPLKISRRGDASVASSPSHSMVVKPVDGSGGIGGVRQMDRMPSAQSDMTARVESPEPGRSRSQEGDTSPDASKQFTFRELDAPRRPPLSEREKADIWDDLLARSDKAGGTLHINGAAELLSDNMRFSTLSEI